MEEFIGRYAQLQEHAEYALGANVRARRKQLGYSQAALARLLVDKWIFWHQTVIAKVEDGKRAVKLDEAYALASVLEIELEDLVLGHGISGGVKVQHSAPNEKGEEEIRLVQIAKDE